MFEKFLKFFSADGKDPAKAESSQKLNIIVVAVGLFAILLFLMILFDDNKKTEENVGEFKIVNEEKAVKTKWIGQVAPEVEVSNKK